MMTKLTLSVCVIVVCLLLIAPGAMAKPPEGKSPSPVDESVLRGDFVSGPTAGKWGQSGWFVLGTPAINIKNSPGGEITINNVPDRFETTPGTSSIEWDTHGERIKLYDHSNDGIKSAKMKAGTYTYPGDDIGRMVLQVYMDAFMDGGTERVLTISMSSSDFDVDDEVTITVTKSTITISGTDIPFNYLDWSLNASVPEDQGGGLLLEDWDHDFEITIDR